MESLSRPFHSRKLSNAASFSTQNPYDAVFTNHRRKFAGPSPIDVQDYREIFSGSQNSSIPVLDLSKVDSLSFNFRDSKPDYSNIFGGFCDKDVAVSYEELFGCDKLRTHSSKTPNSQDSDDLSQQSPDALKQFNMSYNKISPKSKDGLDGTKHVTQIPAVSGFTCFVDEPVMDAKKPNPSAVNANSRNVVRRESKHLESVVDEPVMEAKKPNPSAVSVKSSRKAVEKESNHLESIFDDKKSRTFNIDFENRKYDQKRSRNLESSKPDFDEGIDVNSDASAALRKAIEKAQESIRIAKESVGRKKNGLRNFSNKKFQKRLELEGEDSSQVFQDVDTNRKYGAIPNFMESEKLFVAKKFMDEISEKISESVKDSKFRDDNIACNEAVDMEASKIDISDFVNEDEGGVNAVKPSSGVLEDEIFVKEVESEEKDTNEENRLDASVEILEASERVESENEPEQDKHENVLEHEDSEYAENEEHEVILEASERAESENESGHDKQENVLEDEDSEYAENEKREEIREAFERVESENESGHDKQENVLEDEESEYAESENHDVILEAFERVESENASEHDQNSAEMFDDFCEIDAKDNVQIFVNKLEENEMNLDDDCAIKQEDSDDKLEESEVILHDDYETKQEDDKLDESCDEKSSSDDNIMEETDNINYVHDASDINVETTRIASDDEDEYEVKSEENNIIENLANLGLDNDGNIQLPQKEIPDAEKSNKVKDSDEPESRHKEDEVEESGPSRVSQKAQFNKIDEEASVKRREWEKNRLAVERVVREARERAFAEARERAERERAAVEKAKEEVRQRMVAEAHEKVSKASVEKTTSTERAKLRAERAAVERATSEARQRALEKAVSQKTASDLNRTESALRTKAKLEKHNRIMERAAKALAEKEKRDRLAQKEQAERNRLAENLDASIKRWSSGKEGNLRALLSTLQYILGPESGWQPVTLTEIITTSAVKKAYRKATLCVHPDKLQQRGATIQHKYICEKVFDLLKAAWNKFNSEER